MTLAFVVGIVGYLVGMLHGKRLSRSRPAKLTTVAVDEWAIWEKAMRQRKVGDPFPPLPPSPFDRQIIVNTQYNAHPPVS